MGEVCQLEGRMKRVESKLDDHDQRLQEGAKTIHEIQMTAEDTNGQVKELLNKNQSLFKRLFVDNGTPSFQTRMDRHENFQKLVLLLLSALLVATVSEAVHTWLTH